MRIIDDQNKVIRPESPDEVRVAHHLARVGAKDFENLTFEQREKLFLMAVKDFLDGTFSLDAMSSFANLMVEFPESPNKDEDELNDAIYAGAELNFYVRKIPEVESQTGNFITFMTQVKNYYQKYNHD